MGGPNLLDPESVSARADDSEGPGHDRTSIGPSDSSDSGSDLMGTGANLGDLGAEESSDRNGTGERLSADAEAGIRVADDIAPDRIVTAEEAGLGGGLDQAEEARLGITDEELARRSRNN